MRRQPDSPCPRGSFAVHAQGSCRWVRSAGGRGGGGWSGKTLGACRAGGICGHELMEGHESDSPEVDTTSQVDMMSQVDLKQW